MCDCYVTGQEGTLIPIKPLSKEDLPHWLDRQDNRTVTWVKATGFKAEPDTICCIPSETGKLNCVLLGVKDCGYMWHFGGLPQSLPAAEFQLDPADFKNKDQFLRALLAFGLGSYQFSAYREKTSPLAKLNLPSAYQKYITDWLTTIYAVRDLINTPAEHMGPSDLAEFATTMASDFNAEIKITRDKALKDEFPAVYAVGRAASQPPLFIDLQWGDAKAPKLTLVGKGVCFDSGGLDIKKASGMLLMKKDMSGAAYALGLGKMVMLQELPVRLRILIPAVENAVSSMSYRPGDVLRTRAGKTVEITNTDAEGRVILCDALAEAVSERPDLVIDFASLTGAAHVALGPDLPALFCNQDDVGEGLIAASLKTCDPLWRLPLHTPYRSYLTSEIADFVNSSSNGMAGAITAALFLQNFVPDEIPWAHFDMYGWNFERSPGRPIGGEVMALRSVFHYLEQRYSATTNKNE